VESVIGMEWNIQLPPCCKGLWYLLSRPANKNQETSLPYASQRRSYWGCSSTSRRKANFVWVWECPDWDICHFRHSHSEQ